MGWVLLNSIQSFHRTLKSFSAIYMKFEFYTIKLTEILFHLINI